MQAEREEAHGSVWMLPQKARETGPENWAFEPNWGICIIRAQPALVDGCFQSPSDISLNNFAMNGHIRNGLRAAAGLTVGARDFPWAAGRAVAPRAAV